MVLPGSAKTSYRADEMDLLSAIQTLFRVALDKAMVLWYNGEVSETFPTEAFLVGNWETMRFE